MGSKYKVTLTEEEQVILKTLKSHGKSSARKIKRANILLMAHENIYQVQDIADTLSVSSSTFYRSSKN